MMSSAKLSRKIFGPKKMTKELKEVVQLRDGEDEKEIKVGKRLSAAQNPAGRFW